MLLLIVTVGKVVLAVLVNVVMNLMERDVVVVMVPSAGS